MDIKQQLASKLFDLAGKMNLPSISEQTSSVVSQKLVNATSKIGINPGEVVAGFLPLSATADDIVPQFAGSIPTQVTGQLPIAQLTDQIPAIADNLKPPLDTAKAEDIAAMTGSSTAAAAQLLPVVITMATPEAIASNLKNTVPSISSEQLTSLASDSVDLSIPITGAGALAGGASQYIENPTKILGGALGNVTGLSGGLTGQLSGLMGSIGGGTGKLLSGVANGFPSLMENIIEDLFSPAGNTIDSITSIGGVGSTLSKGAKSQVISALTSGNVDAATKLLAKHSDADPDTIKEKLLGIDNSASTLISNDASQSTDTANTTSPPNTMTAKDIGSANNGWDESLTPMEYFQGFSSLEELGAYFAANTRPITEIIISSTNTGTDDLVDNWDSQAWYAENHDEGTSNHFMITREGAVQRGRPLSVEMNPGSWAENHENYAINVCLAGGLTVPAQNAVRGEYSKYYGPAYTPAQWRALDKLLKVAYAHNPSYQVIGINDITREKSMPHFNVTEYVKSKFGKKLIVDSLYGRGAITPDELSSADAAIEAGNNVAGGANP